MKILVLATNYPNNAGGVSLYYIHTRNKFYLKNGIDVTVLNFAANQDYIIDGIKVITLKSYKQTNFKDIELLVLHAPNIRNHFVFLKKYGKRFKKYLFFFHGHEVLMNSKVYSRPYSYVNTNKKYLRDLYDCIKLRLWHNFFLTNNKKCYYIFVSNWMKEQFLKWVKFNEEFINDNMQITYNSVGEEFTKNKYQEAQKKEYDFITIRNNLDGSKYCIDLVNDLALKNKKYKFLIIGKGKYFEYNEKSPNVILIKKNLTHMEIIEYLNRSKCALMPTRTDAQGLMACEMATFGIPLITSDIPVCHEIFGQFKNVEYIDNSSECNLIDKYKKIKNKANECSLCYDLKNTGIKEIEVIKKIMGD